jgi:HEAT repeat protein
MRFLLTSLLFVLLSGVLAADGDVERVVPAVSPDPLASLIQGLHAKEASERIRAADALYELGPQAASSARELVEVLDDPDEEVRKHVIDALTNIGYPAFRYLARDVKRGTPQRRLLAFDVLMRIGSSWYYKPGPALKNISPALFDCLHDEDPDIRCRAIWCMGLLRDVASVPQLLKLLEREKDLDVRGDAIARCGMFGEAGKQAVPVLERIAVAEYKIQWGSGSMGSRAIVALAGIGEPAAPALARLLTNAKLSSDLHCSVLNAVGKGTQVSHVKFAAVIPGICKSLADREEEVRWQAIYALRHTLSTIGSADQPVIAALQSATMDKNPRFRIDVARLLHEFDPQNEVILPTIFQALDHKEAVVRKCACDALNDIGPKAHGAIPKLVHLMSHDKNRRVRWAAIKALSQMGPGIVSAIPALAIAANDPDQGIRDAAQEVLRQAKQYAMKRP